MVLDGQSSTQTFELKKDPRWTQSDEDLSAQYELGMKAKDLLNSCHATIGRIRSVRKQLKAVQERKLSSALKEKYEQESQPILQELTKLEKTLIQTASESGQDPINYPPMLDDQIAYLYSVINGLDDRPNEGAYERYEDLRKELAPHQERMEQLITEIKSINKLLMENGVGVISVE